MLKRLLCSVLFFTVSINSYALPFNIGTKAGTTLPTTVTIGGSVTAYYTVANNTQAQRNNNYIKYLPPHVSQVVSDGTYSDTCGSTFNLSPTGQSGDSCTLQLSIAGEVNANDPVIHHHLFACFPNGISCAGTTDQEQLNVTGQNISQYAYITNNSNSTISYCSFEANGSLSNCNQTATAYSFDGPNGITINPSNTGVYIANETGSTISYCVIQGDGSLNDCIVASTSNLLDNPTDLVLNNTGTVAYITNLNGANPVIYCPVQANNTFGICNATGSGFDGPASIILNANSTVAYVPNYGNGTVTYCSIMTGGAFGTCTVFTDPNSTLSEPNGIAINPAGTYAYIANKNQTYVSYCPINANGSLSNGCSEINGGFNTAFFIAFNPSGTEAYVVNSGTNNVSYCSVSGNTFTSCSTTGTGLDGPRGIILVY